MRLRRIEMNLELIKTDDLLTEVLNRFDHAVFAGMRVQTGGVDEPLGGMIENCRNKGNPRTCQGLATGMIAHIQADVDVRYRPASDDERI